MEKKLISAFFFFFFFRTIYGATSTFITVYKGGNNGQTPITYSTQSSYIYVTTALSGSSFKFTSANPADVVFDTRGNDFPGQFSYISNGQAYVYNGVISRKSVTQGTNDAFYFYETTVLGGTIATENAWLLVIPGRETAVSTDKSDGSVQINSSGVGTALENLRSSQVTNNPPVIDSNGGASTATISINEGTTALTTVHATDANGNALTYSISGGTDASKFSINSSTGVLTFISAPNYEIPTDVGLDNIYNLQVTVIDTQGASDVQEISVNVLNINDNTPVITSDGGGSTASVSVQQGLTNVTIVTATDADAGDILNYSISGGSNASLFTIDPISGRLTFINDAVIGTYTVIVKATDGASHFDTQTLTVTVTSSDITPPTLLITSSDSNLAAGESCTVTFKFSELIDGFTSGDIITAGGSLSNFSINISDPTIFTATLTQSGSGTAPSVTVNNNTYTDLNNNNGTGNSLTLSYDVIPPTVAISSETSNISTGETKIITFTFSENPGTSFDIEDISVTNGTVSGLLQTADPKVWTASLKSVSAVNPPVVSVINHSYTDPAGNQGSSASKSYKLVTPSIDLANNSTSDTGISASDNITNNRKPVISGKSNNASTLKSITVGYYVGATLTNLVYNNVAVNATDSTFTLNLNTTSPSTGTMPAAGLPEGFISLSLISSTDAIASNSFLIDITNPNTPVVTNLTTYDNTPTITGTAVLFDNDVLTVTVNNKTYTLGEGILSINGQNWSLTIPIEDILSTNSYPVVAHISDLAGNTTTGNGTLTVQATTLTISLEHSLTSDTGTSSSDSYTSNQTPVITGTVSSNDTHVNVTVSANGFN